jgi:peptide/nickel transport system permease protein
MATKEKRRASRSERYRGLSEFLNEFRRSRSGILGLIMVIGFALISVYATVRYPYSELLKWNDPRYWTLNPTSVPPSWIQQIIGKALPETTTYVAPENTKVNLTYRGQTAIVTTVDQLLVYRYNYDETPTNVIISFAVQYSKNSPSIIVTWMKPDGTSIELANFIMERGVGEPPYHNMTKDLFPIYDAQIKKNIASYLKTNFNITVDMVPDVVFRTLYGTNQSITGTAPIQVEKGQYRIRLSLQSYNLASDFPKSNPIDDVQSFQTVITGKVYGFMGTDSLGRDLFIGILWGAPVALLIGILTSVISVAIGVFLGVYSGFYGGRVDNVLQRITDYFLILPVLPLLIFLSFILGAAGGRSVWLIIILLSVFGWPGITKVVRSLALQIKESGYVEAAHALGASNLRILIRHILPQTLPYAFANIALSVPGFIFTEASLSFLGLGDPVLPTWGKILGDAQANGAAVAGYWWWVLIPGVCIILVAMSFALLGNALDRILTPRLRRR